jgi:uncharacterized cupredoxin-like copper-binding protein
MEPQNNKTLWWALGGVVAAAAVVYLIFGTGLFGGPQGVQTPQGLVVATGTSPISAEGIVVTAEGMPVEQGGEPGAENAPQQSVPLSQNDIPAQAVEIEVSAAGFSPNTFTVDAGKAVTIAVTATDDESHLFVFQDPALSAVVVGIGPGMTRIISFNAPETPGSYEFRCGVPGHAARGEAGTMIVE